MKVIQRALFLARPLRASADPDTRFRRFGRPEPC